MRIIKSAALAVAAMLLGAQPSAAQLLTFLAATGNDANTCLVQASPCRTLARAITATAVGGEIQLLSQLTGGATITKSMTIVGGGHTLIGSIAVNNANAIVTLRKLSLNGRNGITNGINILNATAVHIEDVTTERFTEDGIRIADSSTEVFVTDSVSRDNQHGLELVGPSTATLTIEGSLFENNSFQGVWVQGGQASVFRSVSSGNRRGFVLDNGVMNVTESTASGNSHGGFDVWAGNLTLKSSKALFNGGYGLQAANGGQATISKSTFANNWVGISNDATIRSLEDNVVVRNTENDFTGAALDTTTVNYR